MSAATEKAAAVGALALWFVGIPAACVFALYGLLRAAYDIGTWVA